MKAIGQQPVSGITTVEHLRKTAEGSEVCFRGAVHKIRDMGEFAFVIVRVIDGNIQCVVENNNSNFNSEPFREEACAVFSGCVRKEPRAPHGFEVDLTDIHIVSVPNAPMPLSVNKGPLRATIETQLNYRPASLRAGTERAKFRIQDALVRAFEEYLRTQGFTGVHTPKLVAASAEGGANVFKMEYFGKKAFLAQSPQFYKQTMVGVLERVFEVGPVFRAEKHSTPRHLNEYTSLDFEMGYIESFYDIMETETGFLKYAFDLLRRECAEDIALLNADIPVIDTIPSVTFHRAKEMVSEKFNRRIKDPNDLEPEEEALIGRLFREEYGSDFVFVTHYPTKKRPFYAMDDPENPKVTLSFDLLFRGTEITTGGQRIHDYDAQVEKMRTKGLDPAEFESYLMLHKYGVPPHGGLGIGLERLCMRLFNLDNIRGATLFPRDINRLEP